MSPLRLLLALGLSLGAIRLDAHSHIAASLIEVNQLIAREPDRLELYLRRAALHEEHGDWAAAETDGLRMLALEGNHPGGVAALARVYTATDRLPRARAVLDRALATGAGDPELLILRARLRARAGQKADAGADYARAVAGLPNPPPDLYLDWAAVLPNSVEGLAVLDAGLARLGPAAVLQERALELEIQLGRTDAALARLDLIIATAERKEGWLKRRGDVLARSARPVEARLAYRQAIAAIEALPEWLRLSPATQALAASLIRPASVP